MAENEIVVQEQKSLTLTEELNLNSQEFYCSMPKDTLEEKKAIYNALGKADYRVSDCLNKTINLKDIIVQKYTNTNEETGEVEDKYRTILIADDGTTFASASHGLFTSCKRLFALLGLPETWTEPVPIQVVEITTKQGFKSYDVKLV